RRDRRGRPAGGDECDAERRELAREVDHPLLVEYREERSPDRADVGHLGAACTTRTVRPSTTHPPSPSARPRPGGRAPPGRPVPRPDGAPLAPQPALPQRSDRRGQQPMLDLVDAFLEP